MPCISAQILCLAESIHFTERCEEAVRGGRLRDFRKEMEQQLELYTSVDLGSAGDDVSSHVLELKLKALILDTIHAMDVISTLMELRVSSVEEWAWQKQLRLDCYANSSVRLSKKRVLFKGIKNFFGLQH